MIFILISLIGLIIVNYILIDNYIIWAITAVIVAIAINAILITIFFKNENFKFYKQKLKSIVDAKLKGKKV